MARTQAEVGRLAEEEEGVSPGPTLARDKRWPQSQGGPSCIFSWFPLPLGLTSAPISLSPAVPGLPYPAYQAHQTAVPSLGAISVSQCPGISEGVLMT